MGKANPIAKPIARRNASVLEALARVRLAPRRAAKDVTLWPLVLAGEAGPAAASELWPLDEALEDGFVGLRRGRAGAVEVESRAPAPVWVPAGEPVGGLGLAAESRVIAPHGRAAVRVRGGDPPCTRCCRALGRAFHPFERAEGPEGVVGFVAAVQDRAVALELVLPAGPLARRLPQRVEAWAPFLLAADEAAEVEGFDSPEALVEALRTGRLDGSGARVEIVLGPLREALTM